MFELNTVINNVIEYRLKEKAVIFQYASQKEILPGLRLIQA